LQNFTKPRYLMIPVAMHRMVTIATTVA